MRRWVVVLILVALHPRRVGADTEESARSTKRLSFGLAAADFANYPNSISDLGVAASIAKPLWLGYRHRHLQFDLSGMIVVGCGFEKRHAYVAASPQLGLNLFLGSLFGVEFHVGPTLVSQLGERSVVGAGLLGQGGYVFRPWTDDRRRIALMLTMQAAFNFASDPGNDLATNASAVTFGVAYETPI